MKLPDFIRGLLIIVISGLGGSWLLIILAAYKVPTIIIGMTFITEIILLIYGFKVMFKDDKQTQQAEVINNG